VTGCIGILALTTITKTPPLPCNPTSSGSIEPTFRRAPSILMCVSRSHGYLTTAPFAARWGACSLIPTGLQVILSGGDQNEIPRQSLSHHLRIDKYRWSHFSHTPPRGHSSVRHFNSISLTTKVPTTTNDVEVVLLRPRRLLVYRRGSMWWRPCLPYRHRRTSPELAHCSRIDLCLQVPRE